MGLATAVVVINKTGSISSTRCSRIVPVQGASGRNCVPRVQIEPATVQPGDSITVVSADDYSAKMPGDGWVAVAGCVGDAATGTSCEHSRETTAVDATARHQGGQLKPSPLGHASLR